MSHNNTIKLKKSHYHHLSSYERGQIALLHKEGMSLRKIASKINRSPSTVSREIKRNSTLQQNYLYEFVPIYIPETADILSRKRRNRKKELLCKYDPMFFEQLYEEITKKYRIYSVETLVEEWRRLYPEIRVPSFKTIYRFIHLGILKLKLYKLPRMSRLRPRRKKNNVSKKNRKVLGRSIEQRPESINSRSEAGHFEIDAVKGKNGKGEAAAISLVDRVSRYTYLMYVESLTSENVRRELLKLFRKVGKKNFKSITSDNGSEFSSLSSLEGRTLKVYYAHPYSSYERGTNENTNGLLREFLPKGKSMNGLKKEFKKIEECLNNRPRKILGFSKPSEVHNEYIRSNKNIN